MDFLKNLTTPLSERTRSPLYSTFIISWVIVNWKIIYTTLLFTEKDLKGLNPVEYIQTNYINFWDSLILPLLITMGYIFVFPWIEYWILQYSEKIKRKKIDKKIEIGRKHHVSGNLFYDLQIMYEEEKSTVLKFEENLNKLKAENLGLTNQCDGLNKSLAQKDHILKAHNEKLEKLRNRDKIENIMQGRWTLDYTNNGTSGREEFEIIEKNYYVIEGNNRELKYTMELVDFDPDRSKLRFLKYNLNEVNHGFNILNIVDNNILEGFENYKTKVTYKRSYFKIKEKIN